MHVDELMHQVRQTYIAYCLAQVKLFLHVGNMQAAKQWLDEAEDTQVLMKEES